MSFRASAMSVLPPVRRDRVIAQLPQVTCSTSASAFIRLLVWTCAIDLFLLQYFRKEAALHTKEDFNNKVKTACQEQRTGTVG